MNKTSEPSAAALIRAQGQQIRRETTWEYLQRRCGLRGDAGGQENTSYIKKKKMTDKISPDEIILSYLQEANKTTVNWKKPESNGTEYEFKVQVYRVDYTAENGLVLEQDSEFM